MVCFFDYYQKYCLGLSLTHPLFYSVRPRRCLHMNMKKSQASTPRFNLRIAGKSLSNNRRLQPAAKSAGECRHDQQRRVRKSLFRLRRPRPAAPAPDYSHLTSAARSMPLALQPQQNLPAQLRSRFLTTLGLRDLSPRNQL
jgi:hypothetical protein